MFPFTQENIYYIFLHLAYLTILKKRYKLDSHSLCQALITVMANLTLELNINSARNLLNVNLITKMNVFTAITINGENTRKKQKAKTTVDRYGGSNPTWNQTIKFSVDERSARGGHSSLVMRVISRRVLGNKEIGRVNIPLLELLNATTPSFNGDGNDHEMKLMSYQVRTSSGKRSGSLSFSYRFKPNVPVITNRSCVDSAAPSQIEHAPSAPPELPIEFPKLPQPPYLLRHPFAAGSSRGLLPISYGAGMTEQTGHANNYAQTGHANNYAPPPRQGYGPYGYVSSGYGYGSPSYQQRKEMGIGLGLGAGLFGGLMVGDIVSDVANCYDL